MYETFNITYTSKPFNRLTNEKPASIANRL